MKKTRKLGLLNKRPPPKNEFHKPDENITRQKEDANEQPDLNCWWCIDGIISGQTITDPDQVHVYATIDEFFNVKPEGTTVTVPIAAQATRSTATTYLLPSNARYVRSVSVDFLFMDDGWEFVSPRTILFNSPLIATSFVWVRYVA